MQPSTAEDTGTVQYDEKTVENVMHPASPEYDAKQMTSSPIEDTTAQADGSPTNERPSLERWNESRTSTNRYFAALYSFIIMGMNDAASGVSNLLHMKTPSADIFHRL